MKRQREEKILRKSKKQKLEYVNINWKSATNFYNFMNDDTILDYFKLYKINTERELINFVVNKNLPKNKYKYKNNFSSYLQIKCKSFEDTIFQFIENKSNDLQLSYVKISNCYSDIFKYECYKNTKIAIKNKIDIILHGILRNKSNKTYGQSDIIISGRAVKKIFKNSLEVQEDNYFIIDVKYTNLTSFKNTFNLTNLKEYDTYRSQLNIYNTALSKITDTNTYISFLLPYKINNELNIENNLINVFLYDREIKNKINNAITWNNYLFENHSKFSIIPPSNIYLYPNMKNTRDNDSYKLKKYLAEKNGEITQLYQCGIERRDRAFKSGIYSIYDKKLTPEILGFKRENNDYNIIKNMLDCVHNNRECIIPKDNNQLRWRDIENDKELYIDFETFIDENGYNWLYLIGIYYYYHQDDKIKYYKYKSFILDELDIENEKNLIELFLDFITELNVDRIWHWGTYEKTNILKKINQHKILIPNVVMNFCNMIDIFKNKDHPIILNSVFNFSIKSMYEFLKNKNLISYDYDNTIKDGYESMEYAKDYFKYKSEEIKENLLYYNKTDCKLMYDILVYIRKFKD